MGHTVAVSDFRAKPLTDADLSGDFVFVIKGNPAIVPFLGKVKVKKALWFPDDPHGGGLPGLLSPHFDYVFTCHKPQVAHYKSRRVNAFWLPPACDLGVHKPFQEPRKYDFVFIGHLDAKRMSFFNWLSRSFSVLARTGIFLEDMSRAYCSGGIGINLSKDRELTMRMFEVMACDILLFTDSSDNGVADLGLVPDEHFIVYSRENVVELGRRYLGDEALRTKVARQGHNVVRSRHTYRKRMEEVFRVCFG